MMRGTLRRGALAAAGTIAGTAMLCGPAAATDHGEPTGGTPTEPSLTGAAKTYRPNGEDVRFSFDAHGLGHDARGTFRVSHHYQGQGGWFAGKIDCLVVGGPVATATGIITETSIPGLRGVRRGFSVYDHGRRDRVGYSWVLDPGSTESVRPCMSAAPFERLESGGFRTEEWFPPLPGEHRR